MEKRIYRSQDRIIGGVCAGIAERYNWDPVWVRLAMIFLLFVKGIGILVYIALWISTPEKPTEKNAKKTPDKKGTIDTTKRTKTEKKTKKEKTNAWLITIGIILIVLAGVATAGFIAQEIFCEKGSGVIAQENRIVSNFTQIELRGEGELIITQGENYTITLETDDNIISHYDTIVENERLIIQTNNCILASELTAYVTLPEVEAITITGSGKITTNELHAETITLSIAGSGEIDAIINATILHTRIAGSGDATYTGCARTHNIKVAGSGDIKAHDLTTETTNIEIAGSGDAEVNANTTININIAGSGDISYTGNPSVKQKIAGSGDVEAVE